MTSALRPFPSSHYHQSSTDNNQHDTDVRRQEFVVMGVDAEVNIAGIYTVMFRVRDRDEERQDTEQDNNDSDNQQSFHGKSSKLNRDHSFESGFLD